MYTFDEMKQIVALSNISKRQHPKCNSIDEKLHEIIIVLFYLDHWLKSTTDTNQCQVQFSLINLSNDALAFRDLP